MIRINQLMMGFSVGVALMVLALQNAPKLWHNYQLWQNQGISCERSSQGRKKSFTAAIAPGSPVWGAMRQDQEEVSIPTSDPLKALAQNQAS
ncbi:MAG: hypothetical protein HC936_08595 [Leptolyngbyaceae cyanobacterium SU_3_3]|nr:hypothetical protein [Leptolyngbyaceae cyanobacterium SU_3_3]